MTCSYLLQIGGTHGRLGGMWKVEIFYILLKCSKGSSGGQQVRTLCILPKVVGIPATKSLQTLTPVVMTAVDNFRLQIFFKETTAIAITPAIECSGGGIEIMDCFTYLFYFKIFNLFLFLAVLGLCCCVWAFSSCGECGLISSCGVWASHCSGFLLCGPGSRWADFSSAACGLGSCSTLA